MKTIKVLLAVTLTYIFSFGFAQQTVELSDESTMQVTGTSTLHDWEAKVNEMSAKGNFQLNGNEIEKVGSFSLNVTTRSLESGKNAMDKNIYEALKEDSHPYIEFQLKNVKSVTNNMVTAVGDLTIAGNTKEIELQSDYKINNNTVTLTGNKEIDMTEWNIDPPTAMFGTIKTGEKVTIEYNLILNQS